MATSVYYRQYTDTYNSTRLAQYVHNWFQNEESEASASSTYRIATLSLPLISMVVPSMGTAISYASTLTNGVTEIYNLSKSFGLSQKCFISAKNLFKSAIELTCLLRADLRTSLMIHHSVDLIEKAVSCCKNFELNKAFETIPSIFYLALLYRSSREISYKFVLASMVSQGLLSLYRARHIATDQKVRIKNKNVEIGIHVLTAIGRFAQGFFCYQHVQQMKQALKSQQLLIWVHNADKHKNLLPRLAPDIEKLRKVYGEKTITIVMPEPEKEQEAGIILARELNSSAITSPGLAESSDIQGLKDNGRTAENSELYRTTERMANAGLTSSIMSFFMHKYNSSTLPIFVTPYHLTAQEYRPCSIPGEFKLDESLSLTVIGYEPATFADLKFTAWEKLKV
jgi:hypothetical protein